MAVEMAICVVLTEDAYEREYRERRERREREQREREQRDRLVTTATDKPIELTDKERELEQMKVCNKLRTSCNVHVPAVHHLRCSPPRDGLWGNLLSMG